MRIAAEQQIILSHGFLRLFHLAVIKIAEAVRIFMSFRLCIHNRIGFLPYLMHPVLVINDSVFHTLSISAGRSRRHCRKDTGDDFRIDILIQESPTRSSACYKLFHVLSHLSRRHRKRVFRSLSKDGNCTLRTDSKTVLTPPAATPSKSFKLLNVWIAILPELNYHSGTGIYALAAFDTFGFINLKMCFLFCSHGVVSQTLTIIFPLTLPSSCAIIASRISSKPNTFPLAGTSFFSFRKAKILSMTCCVG